MDFPKLIDSLERFGTLLPVVIADVRPADARWRPESGGWSVLEIVCHLADEEVEDFRRRLRLTLENPTTAWPPIDPEGVSIERKYNEQDMEKVLARFVAERVSSIEWLRSIKNANWDSTNVHPKFGPIRAGEVMVSWAAHDQLHLRQIAKRLFQMNVRDGAPYSTDYGGEWKA